VIGCRQAALCLALLASSACAPALMKLPPGPGSAASDGADALRAASAACRTITTITANIAVSGSVGGRGLRVRMLAGLAAPSSVRLEALAPFGQPVFVFVSRENDSTLLLPRDRRVLQHQPADETLGAVAGVPIDAADLRVALTGCVAEPRTDEVRQLGDDWRIVPDRSSSVYLHRENRSAPWRVVAAEHERGGSPSWRAEFHDAQPGLASAVPKSVRLSSRDERGFDLRLVLSDVEINTSLGPEVFTVPIPAGTEPITLEELRQSGPLSSSGRAK
jgi:hypothetical protein